MTCLSENSTPEIPVSTHHEQLVVFEVCVEVDDVEVNSPDEGDVQAGVKWCRALENRSVSYNRLSVWWSHGDFGGFWGNETTQMHTPHITSFKLGSYKEYL